ncbi:MAG: tRNA pseudouridine synthase B [Acidimicrobiales bacterium]|nr:MAG: tRNA pseudouridine synthase B [Acidimicrobiales bacterium]
MSVDKPEGVTSHDVVDTIRDGFGCRRVGHAGTLDPPATGVLVIGIGRATRLLRFVTAQTKEYEAEMRLGVETSTLDASGEVVAVHDMSGIRADDVRAVADRFRGRIEQTPPMVSAVRVGGRRLHELARQGREVERPTRVVEIHELSVEPIDETGGLYKLRVRCSSGTYVRSLVADLGAALGGGAHVTRLRRTAVGSFRVEDANPPSEPVLLDPRRAVADLPAVRAEGRLVRAVVSGRLLGREELGVEGRGPWAVFGNDGELLAVYEEEGERLRPAVVWAAVS